MSEEFFALRKAGESSLGRDFFLLLQRTSDAYNKEKRAAIKLQSLFRASRVRERWHLIQKASVRISRLMRGWLGRSIQFHKVNSFLNYLKP